MDKIFETAVVQTPALVVLVVLVVLFLRYLSADRKARDKSDAENRATLHELGDACHDFQRGIHNDVRALIEKQATTLDANTRAATENTVALRQVAHRLDQQSRGP